ncbi:MAG: fumarylacetoacetate hydrolase family protein [Actinobacteria bacterium]|nr:fumarylacetoacetate hydrolase family protein [Actinomycetota bacterium]
MRVANLQGRLVVVIGDGTAVDVEQASAGRFSADPQAVYAQWSEFREWWGAFDASAASTVTFVPTDLGSPVPAPRQLLAIGLNYREHANEVGMGIPDGLPPVFTKFVSSLTGPDVDVVLPEGDVDWEVELAVVIGQGGRNIDRADAWNHVAGLTVAQDLSERVLQMSGPSPQFSLGKSHDGFCPMGPWVVSVDEIDDPEALRLTCVADGETLQDGTTAEMIVPVPVLIERLSAVVELYPGDVILSGTPAGVGFGRSPRRYLHAGTELVSAIEGIGEIRQRFVTA